jgi:surface antigen
MKTAKTALLAAFAASLYITTSGITAPVKADPPPWAPAHGYRDKHDRDDDRRYFSRREHDRYYEEHQYRPVYVMPWRARAPAPYGIAQGTCYRQTLGAVIGGGTGALLGSTIGKGEGKLMAVAGGAILGFLAGGAIGQSMDEVDQNCIGQALEHAPSGQRIAWRNPDAGNTLYTVTPTQTFQTQDGRYCREYIADARIGGRVQQTYGTACRQPDGSWQIVN